MKTKQLTLPVENIAEQSKQCLRCGQCCHFLKAGVLHPCKFLIYYGSIAFCRIYPNRLGVHHAKGQVCVRESPYNWVGCPYNTEKKKSIFD